MPNILFNIFYPQKSFKTPLWDGAGNDPLSLPHWGILRFLLFPTTPLKYCSHGFNWDIAERPHRTCPIRFKKLFYSVACPLMSSSERTAVPHPKCEIYGDLWGFLWEHALLDHTFILHLDGVLPNEPDLYWNTWAPSQEIHTWSCPAWNGSLLLGWHSEFQLQNWESISSNGL